MTMLHTPESTHRFPSTFKAVPVVLLLLLIAITAGSSNPGAETQRIPQFDNEHVKVWRSVISPNVLCRCIATSTVASSLLYRAAQ